MTGSHEILRYLPREISRSPRRAASSVVVAVKDDKDETAMGREKSDGSIVPEGLRKLTPTVVERGGKGTTASEEAEQLSLFSESAESPQGVVARADAGRPAPARSAACKSESTNRGVLPAMSRISMEEVAGYANLVKAFEHVASNKGAPGPDGESIEAVREHLSELVPRLARKLLDGSYRPGMIRRVWIPKYGGRRGLGIPDVIDRLVQQAVHQVLSPHYEADFHRSSHGFRPGKSCHSAITEAKSYVEDGYEWVVDIDLEKFFDRVHHQRLRARLEKKIQDRRLLVLVHRMLKAKVVMPDGVIVRSEEGVPQGGPLSPLLSNIVLDELDWELERRGHRFVRYADDCNIYVRSQRAAQRVYESVSSFIQKRLRLRVNEHKSAVARPDDRHFLGFRLQCDPWEGRVDILLSKRSKERIDRRIRALTPRNWGNSLSKCIERLNEYLSGWMGFFHVCTKAELRTFQKLDAHIRRRLRAIKLKQWKRKRTIAKRLIRLGFRPKTVWRRVYAKKRSWWALSRVSIVQRGLGKAYFVKCGFWPLADRFLALKTTLDAAPKQLALALG